MELRIFANMKMDVRRTEQQKLTARVWLIIRNNGNLCCIFKCNHMRHGGDANAISIRCKFEHSVFAWKNVQRKLIPEAKILVAK